MHIPILLHSLTDSLQSALRTSWLCSALFSLFLRLVMGFFLTSFMTGYYNFPRYIQAPTQGLDDNGFKSHQKQEIFPPKTYSISFGAHPASYSIDYGNIPPEVGGRSLKFSAHLQLLLRLWIRRTILLLPLYALIVWTGAKVLFVFGTTALSGTGPPHSLCF
jgi:hypothetical protein